MSLGGSSSINGLVYVRGSPFDFDRWQEEGARGWAYRDVLPYFKRSETRAEGGDLYRGSDGPLHTCYGTLKNPLYRVFIAAARQAGYPETQDINGYQQEGFGRMDMTVHAGRRWSAANAYLKPALRRPNLAVRTGALATRLLAEGRRITGVRYRLGASDVTALARRAVVVAAGPINSPQILLLSGVGPGEELRALGIPVVHDLPGVGRNLQDHLEFYFQVACTQPITLFRVMNPFAKALVGARWLLRRDGLGATNHFESGGFIRSRAGVRYPDIQFHFLPLAVSYDGRSLATEHGFQAHVGPMRSKSRGTVRLRSPDPRDKPRILFNYMSHPDDWTEMRACVRLTREIFAQAAFAPYRGREIQPGAGVTDDPAIDAFVRRHVESAYHPCGTCRMGDPADAMAVVDPTTRAIGLDGPARGRLFDHALDHHRQPQRADDYAGREGRRPYSRTPSAAAFRRAGLRGAGLADGAAMMQRSPAHPPGTLTNRRTRFAFRSASWTRAAPHSGGAALQGGVVQRWRL